MPGVPPDLDATDPSLLGREAELQRLVSLHAATLESTADGLLVLDLQGRVQAFNQRLLDLWGVPREALEGQSYDEAMARVTPLLMHPDTCAKRFDELLASPEAETSDVLELVDGRTYERYSRPQRLGGRTVGRVFSYRDVTERLAALRQARESEARMRVLADVARALADARLDLRAVAEVAAVRIAELFEDGCYVRLARPGEAGYETLATHHVDPTAAEVLRRVLLHLSEPLDPVTVAYVEQAQEAVLVRLSAEAARRRMRPEIAPLLERYPIRAWMVAPLRVAGGVIGYLVVFRFRPGPDYGEDDRRFLQALADRVAVAIDNARLHAEAQDAIRLRDEFLLAASHELRTPLTPLKIRLQLLAESAREDGTLPPETVRRYAEGALGDVGRLVRLVEDMVLVSRLEVRDLELERGRVDLVQIVGEALSALGPTLAAAGCRVEVTGATTAVGWWDRRELEKVVHALLSNALKFGPGRPVEVDVAAGADRATLTVRDHGRGVDPADRTRIFERFVRGVSTRHYGGLGLGLYLARRVVEAHGGRVHLEATPGGGASFVVELPVAPG